MPREPLKDVRVKRNLAADLLGLTTRRLDQLVNEGQIVRTVRGLYSVVSICRYLREKGSSSSIDEDSDAEGLPVLDEERAKLTQAKAELAALKLQEETGRLLDGGEVERTWVAALKILQTRLLALPTKMAPRLVMQSDLRLIEAKLKEPIHNALRDCANARVKQSEKAA